MSTTTISADIQQKFSQIESELRQTHKERAHHIHVATVALIANQHVLYVAKGGTGKSMMIRDLCKRILGNNHFEMAGDESTDPGEAVGPTDILAIRDKGVQRRVLTGYLCEADTAFLDEFFNLNGVTRHKLMPILNERVFHNGGEVILVPLRFAAMATNILDVANNQAAVWDRIHYRMEMEYVSDRHNKSDLVREAMARKLAEILQNSVDQKTTVTKEEWVTATAEAYALPVPEAVEDVFQDIHEELLGAHGIEISTRRMVEGMSGVLSNAWLAGHTEVRVSDLDILQHMWWIKPEDIEQVRTTVLTATNPGEKAALDKLDDLDKLRKELKDAVDNPDLDQMKRHSVGIDVFRNCDRLLEEAKELRQTALASGSSTARVDELEEKVANLQADVGKLVFGVKSADSLAALTNAV